MVQTMLFIFSVFFLFSISQGQPSEKKVQRTFIGEIINCYGTSAAVNIEDAFVQVNDQAVVQAVAESVANAITSPDNAKAEARVVGKKVLEVTAEAVAKIDATVNSPAQGCWGVAFGTANAVAIATAIVDAVAEGLSAALSPEVATAATARARTREQDVKQSIEQIALLLARGDGSGKSSKQAEVTATAKATAINCALAEAYAEIFKDDTAVAEAIVQAGCPTFEAVPTTATSIGRRVSDPNACACKSGYYSSAPKGCGVWGGADNICYVQNPSGCFCAQSSDVLPGEKWRFCDSALADMKVLLDFNDFNNSIQATAGGFGYCPFSN